MTYLADQGLRCVAYDRRGHGRSSQPGGGYDFDTLADDLSVLLEHLDLRDVTLVGHSMGCAEVVRYLARYGGSRVARAVLVSTVTPYTAKAADNPDGVDRSALEAGRALLRRDFPRRSPKRALLRPSAARSARPRSWSTGRRVLATAPLELHRAFTRDRLRPELRTVPMPTLLVHGDSDVATLARPAAIGGSSAQPAGGLPGASMGFRSPT